MSKPYSRGSLEIDGVEYVLLEKSQLHREIACVFAELDADKQAAFWECLDLIVKRWSSAGCFQWDAMSRKMNVRAKAVFADMADYVLHREES